MEVNNLPFVSVIIPAFNEANNIGSCLEALQNLNYPRERYEIIVVDNGSTDETVVISQRITEKVYICPNLNISALRNYGVKKAIGEIYAFIDADCIADPHWLKNAIASFINEPSVIGSKYKIPQNATWVERAWFSQTDHGRREVSFLGAGNMLMRSDTFKEIGGFNEKLTTGEDYEFCMRAKTIAKVISDDSVKVVHLGNPKTLKQFLKREIWYGLGAFGSLKLNLYDKPLIGTFLFLFIVLLDIIGLICFIFTQNMFLLFCANIALILLLSLTILYRINYVKSLLQALQLGLLYLFFYIGRSVSLVYIVRRKAYARKKGV
jgi:glycosyltransferase involved in cell wall biosynthesis